MALATLSIDLTASLARFEQGLGKAVQVSQATADRIGGAFAGVTRVAGALGVAATAAFAALQFRGSIDAADRIDDLAEKYGIAAGKLSQYRYAAEVAGTPTEALASGMNKLSKAISEGNRAFDLIGVRTKDTNGNLRSVDDVLVDLADKFADYEDGAGKAALATAIFGKSGADLIPLLNQGGQGIRNLRSEAIQLGAAFGDDLAKQAGQFNDNLKRLELSAEGAKIAIVGELLPTLNATAEAFIRNRKEAGLFMGVLVTLGEGLAKRLGLDEQGQLESKIKAQGNALDYLMLQLERMDKWSKAGVAGASEKAETLRAQVKKLLKDQIDSTGELKKLAGVQTAAIQAADQGTPRAKKKPPGLGDGDQIKDAAKQYEALVASIRERIAANAEELSTGQKISEQRRFELNVLEKLGDSSDRYTDAQRRGIQLLLESNAAGDKLAATQRDLQAAQAFTNKLTSDTVKEVSQEVRARIDANEALRMQAAEYGKTAEEVEALRIARLDEAAAIEEQALAMAVNAGAAQDEIDARKQNLTLLRQQISLRRQQADIERGDRGNALVGAQRAVNDYLLSIQQAGTETERAVASSIGALENDLTNSLVSGTFSVRSFVNTALAEFTRLAVVRPLMQSLLGDGGGGSLIGSAIKLISGGRANGGPVSAGRMYEVNERGAPELLNIGNRQLLMMGKQPGTVTPTSSASGSSGGGGGGGGGLTVINHVSGGMSRGEVLQAIQLASKQTYATIRAELVQRRVIA